MNGLPILVGDGPATFSTSVGLRRWPEVIFDVNLYYRNLGVDVRATRSEIRDAYQASHGHASERLTYVTKQLLDHGTREEYDSVPLGRLYWDKYLREADHKARVARLSKNAGSAQEIVQAPLDRVEDEVHRDQSAAVWPWSYYVWDTESRDTERLAQWQGALIRAFSQYQEVREIAVGLAGGLSSPWEVRTVGYRFVVFLADDEIPTETLANEVVSRVATPIQTPTAA